MKIIIEGASEEFAREVIVLAAQRGAELTVATVDTRWNADRAERYLRSLPAGARRFAEMVVVDGDGYIEAEQLRQVLGRLNGPTVALSRAIPRGVREGWWPEGIRAPISPVWDADNPSWHKNIAYQMTSENVPIFREAIARLAIAKGGDTRGIVTAPDTDLVDQDGGARPADDDQDEEDDDTMQCLVCLQPYEADEEGATSHLDPALDADHTPRS